jgi:hypothetical protein
MIFDKEAIEQYESIARNLSMTDSQFLGMEDIPKTDVTWRFAIEEPLVRPKKVPHLPTKL